MDNSFHRDLNILVVVLPEWDLALWHSRAQSCGWGHIENKCGSKPKCGSCSGHHQTSDHKCNVVGCIAKQGSLCGHTLETCPNCKGNHIAFSSRCVKKREATEAARQSRKIGLAGRAPTSAA